MIPTNNFQKILIVSILLFLNFSCEKEADESINSALIVPIKLVTTESSNSAGSLLIDYRVNGYLSEYNSLKLNEVTEIELEHISGSYHITGEDTMDGKINMWVDHDEMKSYTNENPLILKFGHYKDAVIAKYTLSANADSESEIYVDLEKSGLYQVDWGDGYKEVLEGKPLHYKSDRSEHLMTMTGEYIITVTTTDLTEVISLSVPSYSNNTNISTMEIGDLPNLSLLDVGQNTLLDGADFSTKFPQTKIFVFFDLTS